jgi:hypothetical protein
MSLFSFSGKMANCIQFNDNLKVRISPSKTAKKCNYECHVILCKVYFLVSYLVSYL